MSRIPLGEVSEDPDEHPELAVLMTLNRFAGGSLHIFIPL